jgi:hypothetical protein
LTTTLDYPCPSLAILWLVIFFAESIFSQTPDTGAKANDKPAMMEYFALKKYKKSKAEKEEKAKLQKEAANGKSPEVSTATPPVPSPSPAPSPAVASSPAPAAAASKTPTTTTALAAPAPVLTETDEQWMQRLLSDDGPAPALPARVKTPDLSWEHSDDDRSAKSVELAEDKKGKGKGFSFEEKGKGAAGAVQGLARNASRRISSIFAKDKKTGHLAPPDAASSSMVETLSEEEREQRDLSRVLDNLNLAAKNDKAFSLSAESTELVRKFTLVLKDLVNGVPTAYGDLTGLLEDRDGVLAKNFEKLPSSLKKLVTQMPNKLTSTLAPELLAVAAEAQGIKVNEEGGGVKGAAKKFFMPNNLQELITKPGAIVSMLKAIMNALKLRWPAFMGTSVLWSVALFRTSHL